MTSRNMELYELEVEVLQDDERFRSILITATGDRDDAVWLPRSEIDYEPVSGKPGRALVTMPQWLAEDRRLV